MRIGGHKVDQASAQEFFTRRAWTASKIAEKTASRYLNECTAPDQGLELFGFAGK
jgi:hypothetical protein